MPVISLSDQWDTAVYAMCVGEAVDDGLVSPSACENKLVGGRDKPDRSVPEKYYKASKICRAKFAHMLSTIEVPTSVEIMRVLRNKETFFSTITPFSRWRQLFFAEMSGERSVRAVREVMLASLPTAEFATQVSHVIQVVAGLEKSNVLEFAGESVKAEAGTLKSWMEALRDNRCPDLGDGNSTFIVTARARLVNFCRKGDGEDGKVGKPAVDQIFEEVECEALKGKTPNLGTLAPLHKFAWLLAQDQQKQVNEWTAAAWRLVGTPLKKATTKGAKKDAGSSKGSVVDAYFAVKPKAKAKGAAVAAKTKTSGIAVA